MKLKIFLHNKMFHNMNLAAIKHMTHTVNHFYANLLIFNCLINVFIWLNQRVNIIKQWKRKLKANILIDQLIVIEGINFNQNLLNIKIKVSYRMVKSFMKDTKWVIMFFLHIPAFIVIKYSKTDCNILNFIFYFL